MDTESLYTADSSLHPESPGADTDLLAAALGVSTAGARRQCLDLLHSQQGSLKQAVAALVTRAVIIPGIGPGRLKQLNATLQLATRMTEQRCLNQQAICSPEACHMLLRQHYRTSTREVFSCLFLNSRHRLLCVKDLFAGTLGSAVVYPREVAAAALRWSAAAVIVAHNHPSGDYQPSQADLDLTVRLDKALGLIDVRLLDHIIVGQGGSMSMADSRMAIWKTSPLR